MREREGVSLSEKEGQCVCACKRERERDGEVFHSAKGHSQFLSLVSSVKFVQEHQQQLTKMSLFDFQLEGVLAAVVHPGKQDREEDLRRAQEVDGHVGGRRQGEVRQAGQRSPYLWSPLLLGQGNFAQPTKPQVFDSYFITTKRLHVRKFLFT